VVKICAVVPSVRGSVVVVIPGDNKGWVARGLDLAPEGNGLAAFRAVDKAEIVGGLGVCGRG
jgi:hypothetical protein